MKIVSAPYYFKYFTIGSTFTDDWKKGLSTAWIDALDDPDDADNYHNWPSDWTEAYEKAVSAYQTAINEIAKSGITHPCGSTILYEVEDEFFASTPFYAHGAIDRVVINDDSNFDSAETAFYAFLNDYRDWEKQHKNKWDAANMLSSADAAANTDVVICEMCGATFNMSQQGDIEICNQCRR